MLRFGKIQEVRLFGSISDDSVTETDELGIEVVGECGIELFRKMLVKLHDRSDSRMGNCWWI